ncbi:MAG TPA: hypothetical protein VN231_05935 [Allosphingosinicella sp.]|nr:hypothetical protein [Allosphingosinicella sp.]
MSPGHGLSGSPASALSPGHGLSGSPASALSPGHGLSGDHLIAVREAVAGVQRRLGTPHLAERTLKGEGDNLPMMEAAAAAVDRVLRGRFG